MITKTERMFYKKCLDMGINSISTKADIERAKLIAKDIGIIDYNNEEALKLRFNNIKAVIIEEEDKR